MPKTLLLIRAVGLQQIDKNLPQIRAHFPDHNIEVLTHPHAASWAAKYDHISGVQIYPYEQGFSPRRKVLQDKTYDIVVVPVGNLSGCGFHNVMQFACTLSAKQYVLCNLVSELKPFTPNQVRARTFQLAAFRAAAALGATVWLTLMLPIFAWTFLSGLRRRTPPQAGGSL